MASVSMSAIVPLLGDNRTQRGHHQNDVNDPEPTFGSRAQCSVDGDYLFADFVSVLGGIGKREEAKIRSQKLGSNDFLSCGDVNEIRPS